MISRLDAVSKDGRANISGRWAANLTQSIEIKPFDELQDLIADMRHLSGRQTGTRTAAFGKECVTQYSPMLSCRFHTAGGLFGELLQNLIPYLMSKNAMTGKTIIAVSRP